MSSLPVSESIDTPNIGKPAHNKEYKSYYFNNCVDWQHIEIQNTKLLFLINENHEKKRFLIFKNYLGYNETNIDVLTNQIYKNATNNRVYLCKTEDKYGFRVKIYMRIYSIDKSKSLIIRTGWLIKDGYPPRFITTFYEEDYERNMKDEI